MKKYFFAETKYASANFPDDDDDRKKKKKEPHQTNTLKKNHLFMTRRHASSTHAKSAS